MFAIIKTGGKQYKIQVGDVLSVEKIPAEAKQRVLFNQVLLIGDDQETLIGTPYLENAAVRAQVLENFKDEKVIVFKKKRRKQYRRTRGHRQQLTRLLVEKIFPDVSSLPEEELRGPAIAPEPAVPAEEKAAAALVEAKPAAPAEKKPAKKEAKARAKAEAAALAKSKKPAKPAKEKAAKAPAKKKGA
jgi:large subunit ribosomal protein L21